MNGRHETRRVWTKVCFLLGSVFHFLGHVFLGFYYVSPTKIITNQMVIGDKSSKVDLIAVRKRLGMDIEKIVTRF